MRKKVVGGRNTFQSINSPEQANKRYVIKSLRLHQHFCMDVPLWHDGHNKLLQMRFLKYINRYYVYFSVLQTIHRTFKMLSSATTCKNKINNISNAILLHTNIVIWHPQEASDAPNMPIPMNFIAIVRNKVRGLHRSISSRKRHQ